jgi:hypothetical protein
LIEVNVRRVTERLTNTPIEHATDPSGTFRGALAAHRGPWLLVFDGAAHRHLIDKFVPTHGNGSVILTTVDETGLVAIRRFAPRPDVQPRRGRAHWP